MPGISRSRILACLAGSLVTAQDFRASLARTIRFGVLPIQPNNFARLVQVAGRIL